MSDPACCVATPQDPETAQLWATFREDRLPTNSRHLAEWRRWMERNIERSALKFWREEIRKHEAQLRQRAANRTRNLRHRRPGVADRRVATANFAKNLPPELAGDRRLLESDIRILAVLRQLSGGSGVCAPSMPELANRAFISKRAAQMACRRLQELELLHVELRPLRRGHNDTNRYHLRGAAAQSSPRSRRRTAPPPKIFSGGGATGCTVIITEHNTPTSHSTSQTQSGCSSGRETGHVAPPPPRQVRRPSPPAPLKLPTLSPEQLELARTMLDRVDPDPTPETDAALLARIDQLRRRHMSHFSEGFWRASVCRHGAAAYLAVIETLALSEVKTIRDRAAYLGGILRKPPAECDPTTTLDRLSARLNSGAEA